MTRIQYISDIHTEFYGNENPLDRFEILGDVLVIAGDLSVSDRVIPVLNTLGKNNLNKQIIYIPGNHEFYTAKTIPVKEILNNVKNNITQRNINILYRDIITINDINFIGCVGWPDGSNGLIGTWKHRVYNDFHQIFGFLENWQSWGQQDRDFIKASLENLKEQKNIVITHFLPVTGLIAKEFKDDYLNGCFANNWINWIIKTNAKHWIYGHSHINIEKKIENVNFYSNQVGYKHEINEDFVPYKYFEI